MPYKRILTIQDISCIGQCSMTVALPILSACGHETCVLPTALLSTHTGGFGKPSVVHFDVELRNFLKHWQENQILFDAILVGYLGSAGAVSIAEWAMEHLLAPGGIFIVDPAMADHGKCYSGLSEEYTRAMEALCRKADVIIPNVTEAAIFGGMPFRENVDAHYISELLDALDHPCVVLTGVEYEQGKTGIVISRNKERWYYAHDKIGRSFHGTGDMFAACFTGSLMQGKDMPEAAKIAGEFVRLSIENTIRQPAHWYGVKFETVLPELIHMLQKSN